MSTIGIGYAMLQYGSITVYERKRKAAESHQIMPSGEGSPPVEFWIGLHRRATTAQERSAIVQRARDELAAWKRRPDPPPEGESFDQMLNRMLKIGEGWEPRDVALAFRCTPTQVRRWRMDRDRNPETGRVEGSVAHARELIADGMSLRQVAMITGIPKSTLHEALDRAA